MDKSSQTIVAVSSPPGPAGRAVIRLSGPRALAVAGRLAGRRLRPVRRIVDARVLGVRASVWIMPAPRSYTREDVVELHLPGAEPLVREAVERCLATGARAAEPGEFTRRAFLNGRIDLAQAEAVQEIISAGSARELRAAEGLLRGGFSRRVRAIEDPLLTLAADVEAAIDFTDQDIEIVSPEEAGRRTRELRGRLDELLAETAARRVAQGPPSVFLYGPAGAGKSSLFNRLTGGTAIVSPVPGTTRDVLTGECEGVRLLDAPGMHEAEGVDADAVRRARGEAGCADGWVAVIDGTRPAVPEGAGDRPVIWVVSKADAIDRARLAAEVTARRPIFTSAVTGEGLDELRERLKEFSSGAGSAASGARFAVSLRQRERLREAARSLAAAEKALSDGLGMEFAALDLRAALEAVGSVTGRQVGEDLLDRIFERFCVGK